jgi:hypothetical protein
LTENPEINDFHVRGDRTREGKGEGIMKRSTARQQRAFNGLTPESPAERAERGGYGPKISLEKGFLTLRWNTEQAGEAMDSAGMSLEEVLRKHLVPRLEATRMELYRYRGQVTKYPHPDWKTQLEALELAFQLHGVLPYE